MYKFLALFAVLGIFAQASNAEDLSSQLDEMSKIIMDIRSEQLKRGISIIVQKKQLAKQEKGDEAEKCAELEGNKYLQQLENNNVESTSAFLDKLDGYKKDVKNGKDKDVEKAMSGLKSEFEGVLTNMQAKGETITLAYVAKANQCRGLDH
uniref:Heteropteran venom family 6 protein 1 n=1 Tax=Oncocephalus sp. TaxID=2944721 RepID=A0AB38ZEI4_9HEMI